MSVVLHPSAVLAERLRKADKSSGADLVRLFFEAIDLGAAREPILKCFLQQKRALSVPDVENTELFAWSGQRCFEAKTRRVVRKDAAPREEEAPVGPTSQERELLQRVAEAAWSAARSQGELSARLEEIASVHRYGMFPPGWQIDNVEWSDGFGSDDPCQTVADYIRALFSGSSRFDSTEPTIHVLGGADRKILDVVLSGLAKKLVDDDDYFQGYDRATIRRVLNTACEAWVWDNEVDCLDPDLIDHLMNAPKPIARALLNLWANVDHWTALDHDEVRHEVVQRQNVFVAALLVRHLMSRGVRTNSTYPLEQLLDELNEEAIDGIPEFSAMKVQDLLRLKAELWNSSMAVYDNSDTFAAEAIYNARDVIFGGAFPFPISEAHLYIGALERDTKFWLACVSRYSAEDYGPQDDPYRVFEWGVDEKSDESGSDLCRSTIRFAAFCSAYIEMRETRLDELADAWWAFFIASQSLAFPNMGLSPAQLGRLADMTKACIPNKMIEKALRLALAQSDEEAQPLQARALKHTIESLLPDASPEKSRIVEMGRTIGSKRTFLERRIGAKTWAALCEQSQNDLLDAEHLWSSASQDYGAGRKDWGAIVAIYARVVESEMRNHLAPVYDALETAGISIRERTFGGCLAALRSANDALRKRGLESLPEHTALRVREVHDFFVSDKARFMKDQRDRAAHGNRETIISPSDFYKWRSAILDQKALSVVVGVA